MSEKSAEISIEPRIAVIAQEAIQHFAGRGLSMDDVQAAMAVCIGIIMLTDVSPSKRKSAKAAVITMIELAQMQYETADKFKGR